MAATQNNIVLASNTKYLSGMFAARRDNILRAMPTHVRPDYERLLAGVLTAMITNDNLRTCSADSVFLATRESLQLGLDCSGLIGQAYLVPFWNNKKQVKEAKFMPGYKGLVELARRSGLIVKVDAAVVYASDEFDYQRGTESFLRHRPSSYEENPGEDEITKAWAMATLTSGETQFDVMMKWEIDAIRARSKSKDSGPWVTDFGEMAKKGLALDTPIPTLQGWKTMEEVEVGDTVFDMDGKPTAVTAVSEVKNLPCFQITFSNGETIVCDDEHRWVAKAGGSHLCTKPFEVQTINDLFEAKSRGDAVVVPVAGAIDTPEVSLPIDPYLLGYWLGNGNKWHANVTCGTDDLAHVLTMIASSGYEVGKVRKDKRSNAVCVGITGGLRKDLRKFGLFRNKHVPEIYLRASANQRLRLLQGLMDSDGHIDRARGRAHFYNTSIELVDAVAELAASLGEVTHRSTRLASGYGTTCIAHFVGWKPSKCCVLNPRKVKNFKPRAIQPYRTIESITRIPSVPTRCIAVASDTKTYLAGITMVPTHNTVVKRLLKLLPISIQLATAMRHDDNVSTGTFDEELPVDGETVQAEPASKTESLKQRIKKADKPETEPENEPAPVQEAETEPQEQTGGEPEGGDGEGTQTDPQPDEFDEANFPDWKTFETKFKAIGTDKKMPDDAVKAALGTLRVRTSASSPRVKENKTRATLLKAFSEGRLNLEDGTVSA